MPIAEIGLIIKGGMAIGHWLAAHGTSTMAAKAAMMIGNNIAAQGVAAAATALGTGALASSYVVGNIIWAKKPLKHAANVLQAIEEGDTQTMITEVAKLCLILEIRFHMLPDAFEDLLTEVFDYSSQDAHEIAEYIKIFEKEIKRQMDSKRK